MSAWTFDRKLNLLEHPYADMAEAGAMNAVFILRIGAVIPPAALRAGLDAVQRCFDGAAVRLVRRDGAWFFSTEGVPPVPMRVVMRESESDWIAAAERELNLPFPELGPFFRLTVLQPNAESAPRMTELILTAHHVVGDLNTAFRVCEVLLSECQRIQDGRPPIDISRVDLPEISASMLPPEAQGQVMERRVRFAKAQYGHLAPVEKPLPLGRTRIEYRELPGGYLSAITRATCRRKLLPLALPLAAKLIATARLEGGVGQRMKDWGMSLDAREMFRPPVGPDRSGCLVLLQKATSNVAPDADPWELARQISGQAEVLATPVEAFSSAVMARELIPLQLARGIRRSVECAITFNGSIHFVFSGSPDFPVVCNWSQASVHAYGPRLLSSITEFGGLGTWNIAYTEPDLTSAHVANLMSEAIRLIDQALLVPPPSSQGAPEGKAG